MRVDEEARLPGIGASALTEVEIARKTAVTCVALTGGCGGVPGVAGLEKGDSRKAEAG
ncbi:hypothetical protein K0M31_000487 [Melipona bicolor]|uniref:Uncharacterized protein n=1 Tax=Melipona bicolor TaxID=60889 RepID=A0AA40GDV0_9HYME|nr:hypothetical protein K0M31_000487 [Melipona bicolor]